jgi:Fe-S-cluster containining protein
MNVPRKTGVSEDGRWFAEGLRFRCTRCGACCTGEPGFVWVRRDEIARLAARFDLPVHVFAARYLRLVEGRVSLRERANGDCVFFKRPELGCTVYEDRPTQCRTYPFWPELLRSAPAWAEETERCPGIGRGRLWTAGACAELARTTRRESRRTARTLPQDANRVP